MPFFPFAVVVIVIFLCLPLLFLSWPLWSCPSCWCILVVNSCSCRCYRFLLKGLRGGQCVTAVFSGCDLSTHTAAGSACPESSPRDMVITDAYFKHSLHRQFFFPSESHSSFIVADGGLLVAIDQRDTQVTRAVPSVGGQLRNIKQRLTWNKKKHDEICREKKYSNEVKKKFTELQSE